MTCQLCNSPDHKQEFHDTELLNFLATDSHQGDTNGRAYYSYKRREKKDYKGLREDTWEMMHKLPHSW